MDQKDLNEPLGSATEAIVDTTTNDANKSDDVDPATEVTKSVKTETDDVTVTESVTEAPADSGSSDS